MVECTGNMGCGETVTVTTDEVVVYAFAEGTGDVEVGPESVKDWIRVESCRAPLRDNLTTELLLRELEHCMKTAKDSPMLPFHFAREQRPREVTVPAQFDGDEDAAVAAGWVLSEFGLRCPKCELADGGDTASLEPFDSEFLGIVQHANASNVAATAQYIDEKNKRRGLTSSNP